MGKMSLVFFGRRGFTFLSWGGSECLGRFWGKENFVMLGIRGRERELTYCWRLRFGIGITA